MKLQSPAFIAEIKNARKFLANCSFSKKLFSENLGGCTVISELSRVLCRVMLFPAVQGNFLHSCLEQM